MKNILYTIIVLIAFCACDQGGVIDGGIHSPNVNKTTLAYLQDNAKFDTVLILFEKANLLPELEKKGTTICIPTDYSVNYYIKQIQQQKRIEQGDENLKYAYADFINEFDLYKDSLKMYIMNQPIGRLELEQKSYLMKNLLGEDVELSLKKSPLYNEWLPNINVKLVHYKWVKNGLDIGDEEVAVADKDIENICQTSGILTTNGVLHVLEDTHQFFFNSRQTLK